MNRIFRSLWNASTGAVVAVSELTSCAGAGGTTRVAGTAIETTVAAVPVQFAQSLLRIAVLLALMPAALALPVGGEVTAGSASIAAAPGGLVVNQASQNAALNWTSFNIGRGEAVRFIQPNAASVALNRVLGADPSTLLGNLSANGKVFVVNPNGILFGKGAQVNVGGLVASTLTITDSDFMAGRYRFTGGNNPSSIVNHGTITAGDGGYVALLGGQVSNQGVISARLGSVVLAAGNTMTLDVAGDGLLQVAVDQGAVNALAKNGGLIKADGGQVLLTAKSANNLLHSAVNNTGVIEARSIENRQGVIRLMGDMQSGTVAVGGKLDASAPLGGDGGFIETSAATVKVAENVRVTTAAPFGKTGTWLIDPHDYTVAASGGDITGAVLSSNLETTGITLLSSSGVNASGSGNVNVNDAVSWNANTTLTLTASNNVNVNASITANSAAAGVAIKPNTANGGEAASGTGAFNLASGAAINLPNVSPASTTAFVIGTNAYTVINSLGAEGSITGTDLQGINGNLAKRYALGSNLDASLTSAWESGAGFKQLGNATTKFTSTFNGLGHTISNLTINRPADTYVGLMGFATGTSIANIGLTNVNITGLSDVGGLVGRSTSAISNSYATGGVSGILNVGGLVGFQSGSTITSSYASVAVAGTSGSIGGLIGGTGGTITKSYATGNVTGGGTGVGGLIGLHTGSVTSSYATGNVTNKVNTPFDSGGLIGYLNGGTVSLSYATGKVDVSGNNAGGLVGYMDTNPARITNSYATGDVTSTAGNVGGLLGSVVSFNVTSYSYSTGKVTGASNVGGLIGNKNSGPTLTNSYWDVTTSGKATSSGAGAAGKTTAQMQLQSTFTGWDFGSNWANYDTYSYPLLRALLTPLTVTANNVSKTYDRASYSGNNGASYSVASPANVFGTLAYGGASQGAVNAGSYAITPSGLYSNQQGYLITYANGTLVVNPKPLTVTGLSASNKTYDGTTVAVTTGGSLSGVIAGDTVTLTTMGSFATKNVGTAIGVTAGVTGASAGNYTFSAPGTTADITAKALTVTGSVASNKVYDGTTAATLSGGTLPGVVGGDTVTLTQGGNFATKNVGTALAITASDSLAGADAGNYALTQPTGLSANVMARPLTVTATGINKVYDGGIAVSFIRNDNRVTNDSLTITNSGATFSDKNVATGKTVNVTGINVIGTDAGNYTFNTSAATTADITPRPLMITATGVNKVYDGGVAGSVALNDNRITNDILTLANTAATFADKNVATGKALNVTGISVTGADAGNYTFNTSAATTADITPRALTITATGINKVYDGGVAGSVTLNDNRVSGDILAATSTANFADKNVATGKAINVTGINVTGSDAGNYTFNTSAATTADITPKALTVNATGINKVYDGGVAGSVALSDNRIAGDILTTTSTASFADKNVATGKALNVSGITVTGADAGNYTFNTSAATTADITPKALTVAATGVNKVYDGGTAGSVSLNDNRVAGDILTTASTASFADKNVATGKAVNVTGITVTGTDASNYTFNTTAATTENITPKALTVTAVGINKVYDGGVAGSATLSDNRVSGDILTTTSTASFADKNVATGKALNVSGITVTGIDAGNYTFNTSAATTADIAPKVLTITATGINKVYDGGVGGSVTLNDNRVAGDILSAASTASFADKNVATGKTLNVSGITVTGADAGNYTFNTSTATTADITPKALTITATGINKVYDGGVAGSVILSDNRVTNDSLTVNNSSASFTDKNVATGKTVNVAGINVTGIDAGNYTFNTSAATTADITPKALTITATGINKVYDGGVGGSVTLNDNRVAGDILSAASTASFADKNVASGKAVTVSGIAVTGADASNYTFNTSTATTADITPRALTVTATGINKVYDGGVAGSVTLSDNRVSGDILSAASTANFADKNVAIGKTVNVTGITVTGADAGNYTFNTSAATTADITPKTLTVTATGINKVYDGGVSGSVTLSDNRVSGDILSAASTASFGDKNVATGKAVSVSGITVTGIDAGNYTFNTSAATTADITPKVLTITATGVNKVYDGGVAGSVTLSDNRVAGDILSAASTANFADKNVATGKAVNVTGIAVTGADAGNYTFNTNTATTADITPRALTVTATGINKVYDGGTAGSVTMSDNRITSDSLTVTNSGASFTDKNVATGKTVNVAGINVTGIDAGNYTFNTSAATTADITPKALTITATGINKVYDGGVAGSVTLSDNRIINDSLTLTNSGASFTDKNVATGKSVNVAGINVTGTDAGNYTFNTSAATTADITPKALTVSATGINKVYDGGTVGSVTLSDNRITNDSLTLTNSGASFTDKMSQ